MEISKDTVKYVARLARIKLDAEETDLFSGQIEEILKYMEKLNQAQTSHIPPTSHILPIKNIYRQDNLQESLDASEALENSPRKKNNCFSVPKVIV